MNSKTILPLLAVGLLGAQASALQTTFSKINSVPRGSELVDWNNTMPGGANFESVDVLDLDADGARDAVVQDAGFLAFLQRPEDFSSVTQIDGFDALGVSNGPLQVNDFALLDEASGLGGNGYIVAVSNLGLEFYAWDSFLKVFVRTQLTSGNWAGATRVELVDWDADGDMDVVGLDATGLTAHVRENQGGGVFTDESSVSLGAVPCTFLVPLNWQGNARLELAAVNPAGLVVYNKNGVLLSSTPTAIGTHMIARAQGAGALDQLAWAVGPFNANGDHILATIDATGTTDTLILANPNPASLSSGNFNNDGISDLAITYAVAQKVDVVVSAPGTPYSASFIKTYFQTVTPSLIAANTAPVAFGDFDFDGKPDLVTASLMATGVLITHQDHMEPSGPVSGLGGTIDNTIADGFTPGSIDVCRNDISEGFLTADFLYTGAYETLRVSTYYQEAFDIGMDNLALSTCAIDTPSSQGGTPTFLSIETRLSEDAIDHDFGNNTSLIHIVISPLDAAGILMGRSILMTHAINPVNLGTTSDFALADGWVDAQDVSIDLCSSTGGGSQGIASSKGQGTKKIPRPKNPGGVVQTTNCDVATETAPAGQ